MHQEYGAIDTAHCKTCCNLFNGGHHGKSYRKCIAYGVSHSDATDWAARNKACGLYNNPFDGNKQKPLFGTLKRFKEIDSSPVPGQLTL